MFGNIIKTIILTIFAIIILHFTIEHTKNIWYIPKHTDYDTSYKKIVDLLDKLPDNNYQYKSSNIIEQKKLIKPIKSIEFTNSIKSMETELNEYITNMT